MTPVNAAPPQLVVPSGYCVTRSDGMRTDAETKLVLAGTASVIATFVWFTAVLLVRVTV